MGIFYYLCLLDTEEKKQGDRAIVATRATGSNNFVGVCSSNYEEEKQDEDTGEVFGESFDFTPNIFKRKKNGNTKCRNKFSIFKASLLTCGDILLFVCFLNTTEEHKMIKHL